MNRRKRFVGMCRAEVGREHTYNLKKVLTYAARSNAEVASRIEGSDNTITVANSGCRNCDRVCLTDANACALNVSLASQEIGLARIGNCVSRRCMWLSCPPIRSRQRRSGFAQSYQTSYPLWHDRRELSPDN